MAYAFRFPGRLPLAIVAIIAVTGCRMAPREQVEECHRLSQTLRSENAQLKDQVLALGSQNQDYSERAMDDGRRLAQLEEANRRLETSVQAYQDDRSRLESAYKELRASLPGSVRPLSQNQESAASLMEGDREARPQLAAGREREAAGRERDGNLHRVRGADESRVESPNDESGRRSDAPFGWVPSRTGQNPDATLEFRPPRGDP